MFDISLWKEWSNVAYVLIAGVALQQLLSRLVFPWIFRRLEKRHISQTFYNILLNSVARPLNFLIVMSTLYAGIAASPVSDFAPAVFLHIYRSTIIIAFYGVFYNLADNSNDHLSTLTAKFGWNLDQLLLNLGSSVLRIIIVVFGFITLAKEWSYDVSGVIAGLGLGGLALAMASKDSLANIFGGFVILTDKPFTIGDWINAAGYEGGVEDVTFRSTRIRTIDQGLVYVPNTDMANAAITNFSKRQRRRVSLTIGLDYSTTKEQLEICIKDIKAMLEENEQVMHNSGDILVVFSGYGESSLNIFIIYYTFVLPYVDYMQVNHGINMKIMDIVEEAGTKAALPGRGIYVKEPVMVKECKNLLTDAKVIE